MGNRSIELYYAVPATLAGVSLMTPDILLETISPDSTLLNLSVFDLQLLRSSVKDSDVQNIFSKSISKFIGLPEFSVIFTPRSQINSSQDSSPYSFRKNRVAKVTQTFAQGKCTVSYPTEYQAHISRWKTRAFYADIGSLTKSHFKGNHQNKIDETFDINSCFDICRQEDDDSKLPVFGGSLHSLPCSLSISESERVILQTHCSTPWDIIDFLRLTFALERPNTHGRESSGISQTVKKIVFSGNQPFSFAEDGIAWVGYTDTSKEKSMIDLRNPMFSESKKPIEYNCKCIACTNHSRGYIHHLLQVHEINGTMLIAIHNLRAVTGFIKLVERLMQKDHSSFTQALSSYDSLEKACPDGVEPQKSHTSPA